MQVNRQNQNPQVQYNSSFGCGNCAPVCTNPQSTPTCSSCQPNNTPENQPVNPPVNTFYYPQAPQNTYQVPPNTSGVNIQIFNPTVTPPGAQAPTYNVNSPCYPGNYYTGQFGPCPCQNNGVNGVGSNNGTNGVNDGNNNGNSSSTSTSNTTTTQSTDKQTEKKDVIMLTDEYIKSLENYLNSQQKDHRVNAAKQVYDRLKEDKSRKDDKALTALINKMLQDPSNEVRLIALAALDGRLVTGDDLTVKLLQNMQAKPDGFGQDAIDAGNILLKMTGEQVTKEVPKDTSTKTETKSETKTESKK